MYSREQRKDNMDLSTAAMGRYGRDASGMPPTGYLRHWHDHQQTSPAIVHWKSTFMIQYRYFRFHSVCVSEQGEFTKAFEANHMIFQTRWRINWLKYFYCINVNEYNFRIQLIYPQTEISKMYVKWSTVTRSFLLMED